MSNQLSIRPYEESDREPIAELIVHIQQQEYNIAITREDQPDLMSIPQFYQQQNGNFWVALDGQRVVGTIALVDIDNQQVALRKMFVHADYRGKVWKTAQLLLQQAIQWAEDKQITDIYLGTTPQFLAAHRFYEKNGFVEVTESQLPESFPVMKVDKKFYRLKI
ncbi:GNAT family N-acetyltransferase [Paenibacillus kandeliae]|uniref:GNAT family N-acetyltransferase n=1 Tax=Paenibacillus kandeliae TaxID=3231269 RepID=UPI00345A01DF